MITGGLPKPQTKSKIQPTMPAKEDTTTRWSPMKGGQAVVAKHPPLEKSIHPQAIR
jgi:hypothetical protein